MMDTVSGQLRIAAKNGDDAKLKVLLLDPKCDPLGQDDQAMTALMRSASRGHEACVGLLIPVSDALAKNKYDNTALMWAAQNGHASCVGLLLPVSDALAKDAYGMTALMLAAWRGNASCTQLLLPVSHPLDENKARQTPRDIAIDSGYPHIASLIDAYTLAMSEMASLGSSTGPGVHRLTSLPRL